MDREQQVLTVLGEELAKIPDECFAVKRLLLCPSYKTRGGCEGLLTVRTQKGLKHLHWDSAGKPGQYLDVMIESHWLGNSHIWMSADGDEIYLVGDDPNCDEYFPANRWDYLGKVWGNAIQLPLPDPLPALDKLL